MTEIQCLTLAQLSGGSAYGLDAAGGLMQLLEEKGIGRDVSVTVVPNVCSAVLFDLKCGDYRIRPDAPMGRAAGEAAFLRQPFHSGNYGAGTGATVGKRNGLENAMKGGLGSAAFRCGRLYAAAIFAVNCVGDVVENGQIIAGARKAGSIDFVGSERLILRSAEAEKDLFSTRPVHSEGDGNTVIGVILTNADLTKSQATRLASQGHNAIARMIRPAHSIYDGDTVFALASGEVPASQDAVGILAAHAAEAAILDAVRSAQAWGSCLSAADRTGDS